MAFSFRTFAQVFADAVVYVKANSRVTDFNIGSVARTILEATSLELSGIYVQLVRFKDFFNLELASGDDLTERALEYGCRRNPPTNARVKVAFSDSAVTTKKATQLTADHAAGVGTLNVDDTTDFPANGYLIVEREDGAMRERVSYTGKTPTTFTGVSATLRAHPDNATVILSQQGADHILAVGTKVIAPGAGSDGSDVTFTLTEEAILYDGDITSEEVTALADSPGSTQKVTIGEVTDFASLPWATAVVTNAAPSTGGEDQETDDKLRARCRAAVQTASRGTPLAIERAALDTEIASGTRCNSAQLVEPVTLAVASTLYIHDGGSNNDFVDMEDVTKEILLMSPPAGQTRCRTVNWPLVPSTLKIRKALTDGTANKVGYGTNGFSPALGQYDDLSKNWNVNMYATYYLVDSNGDIFEIASNTSNRLTLSDATKFPAAGPYGIFDFAGAALVEDTDFTLNRTTGEIEFDTALEAGQMVIAYDDVLGNPAYQYYSGLVQEVQKVINGVRSDPSTYGGYRAGGTRIVVSAPQLDTLNLTVSITAEDDVPETDDLRDAVQQAVEDYINGLQIGEAFIHAEAIRRCQAVDGIKDTRIILSGTGDAANVEPLPGHIIRPGTITVQ